MPKVTRGAGSRPLTVLDIVHVCEFCSLKWAEDSGPITVNGKTICQDCALRVAEELFNRRTVRTTLESGGVKMEVL